jgi:hypothetical protein
MGLFGTICINVCCFCSGAARGMVGRIAGLHSSPRAAGGLRLADALPVPARFRRARVIVRPGKQTLPTAGTQRAAHGTAWQCRGRGRSRRSARALTRDNHTPVVPAPHGPDESVPSRTDGGRRRPARRIIVQPAPSPANYRYRRAVALVWLKRRPLSSCRSPRCLAAKSQRIGRGHRSGDAVAMTMSGRPVDRRRALGRHQRFVALTTRARPANGVVVSRRVSSPPGAREYGWSKLLRRGGTRGQWIPGAEGIGPEQALAHAA